MNQSHNNWSRRKFITTVGGAGAVLALNPLLSWAAPTDDDKVAKIVAKTIGIDTHNHIDVPFDKANFNAADYDLSGELKKSGFAAICMTFQVDRPNLTQKGEAFPRLLTSLDEMDEILAMRQMKRALTFADVEEFYQVKHPFVIQSVEGAHFVEGEIERIEVAYNRGLRHLGLMHDNPSYVPLGDIYTNEPKYNGLTDEGKNVIKECNRLGILVDLAHCSNDTINDALKITTKPITISHTGLNTQLGSNEKMAKMMMPRLISKEQAKIVADAGGVIGVWTHLQDTPLELAQNIRAMVDVVGTEHVSIGTDTKMAKPASTNDRFGAITNASWKTETKGFFYSLVEAMLNVGFSEKEIIQIGGGNYWRVFKKSCS